MASADECSKAQEGTTFPGRLHISIDFDVIHAAKGRSFSRTSSILGVSSSTWAIEGGRLRFRLAA